MEEIGRYGSADTEVKISVILECNRAKILTSVSPFSYWRCAHNPINKKLSMLPTGHIVNGVISKRPEKVFILILFFLQQ